MMSALLLSASRQPYRRGGFKIGPKHTPTRIEVGTEIEPEAMLAILRDPVVVMAAESLDENGVASVRKIPEADRAEVIDVLITAINAKAGAAEAADAAGLLLGGFTELQPASGASGHAEGDASTSGASVASSGEANASATSVNSPGDAASPAEDAGQSRQAADEPAADRKAGEDEGKQPEETPAPPVAETGNGPSAEPAAGKPARKAKPKPATEAKDG